MKVGDKVFIPTVKYTEDYVNCLTETCVAVSNARKKKQDYLYINAIYSSNVVVGHCPGIKYYASFESTFKLSDLKIYKEMRRYTIEEIKNKKLAIICNSPKQAIQLGKFTDYEDKFDAGKGYKEFEVVIHGIMPEWEHCLGWFKANGYCNESIYFNQIIFESSEIIGYKFIELKYEKAALKIGGIQHFNLYSNGTHFRKDSVVYDRFLEAGVLDLWFEPVYKNQNLELDILYKSTQTGESKGKVLIGDNLISFDNIKISYKFLDELLQNMENSHFNDIPKNSVTEEFKISFPFVKIGCSTFSIETIKEVVEKYKEFNNIK